MAALRDRQLECLIRDHLLGEVRAVARIALYTIFLPLSRFVIDAALDHLIANGEVVVYGQIHQDGTETIRYASPGSPADRDGARAQE